PSLARCLGRRGGNRLAAEPQRVAGPGTQQAQETRRARTPSRTAGRAPIATRKARRIEIRPEVGRPYTPAFHALPDSHRPQQAPGERVPDAEGQMVAGLHPRATRSSAGPTRL